KLTAEWLHFKLEGNGIPCDLITGDLPQKKRIRLIHKIKEGKLNALIATDVASRGLHISRISHVYNFDLPEEPANYIHRIGRTARAGAKGMAVSLVCDDYGHNLADINELLGEENAIKSEWYDESYLKIEDKAGNPFEAKAEPEEDRPRRDHKPSRDRERTASPGSRKGGSKTQGDRKPQQKDRGGRNNRGDNRPRPDSRAA